MRRRRLHICLIENIFVWQAWEGDCAFSCCLWCSVRGGVSRMLQIGLKQQEPKPTVSAADCKALCRDPYAGKHTFLWGCPLFIWTPAESLVYHFKLHSAQGAAYIERPKWVMGQEYHHCMHWSFVFRITNLWYYNFSLESMLHLTLNKMYRCYTQAEVFIAKHPLHWASY